MNQGDLVKLSQWGISHILDNLPRGSKTKRKDLEGAIAIIRFIRGDGFRLDWESKFDCLPDYCSKGYLIPA